MILDAAAKLIAKGGLVIIPRIVQADRRVDRQLWVKEIPDVEILRSRGIWTLKTSFSSYVASSSSGGERRTL